MNNVLIRKIKAEDADEIKRISELITHTSGNIDFKIIVKDLLDKPENASFVAELDGTVEGFMISFILSGSFGIDNSAWVAMVGVNPKFMGQGVGKQLAETVLDFYRKEGIKEIYTSVRWDSTDLLSFFKTIGFDRSDFINLQKRLD